MAVNLIVTLGTRDIVLKQDIEGIQTYKQRNSDKIYLSSNMEGCKLLFDNFDNLNGLIDFPIISPAISYVLRENEEIDKIILVSTNQKEEPDIDDFHKKNDTNNTAFLLEKILRWKFKSKVKKIKHHIITKNIVFYDDMYETINKAFDSLFRFSVEDRIYLFAQSGIDAINLALLLNCVEFYPTTIQLNKPENTDIAFPLSFPQKFHKRLLKIRALQSLENYNYSAIAELNVENRMTLFANYAFSRLTFDFDAAIIQLTKLMASDTENRNYYNKKIAELEFKDSGFKGKQIEMYLSAKILLKRKAFADFLVRMFTLFEILLKPEVSELIGGEVIYSEKDKHKKWNELLNGKTELVNYLREQKQGFSPLDFSFPNKFVYKAIVDFYNKKEKDNGFEKFYKNLKALSDLRNKVAHEMVKVNEKDIENVLNKINSSLKDFIELADNYFGVSGMGGYDEINGKLKSFLYS